MESLIMRKGGKESGLGREAYTNVIVLSLKTTRDI